MIMPCWQALPEFLAESEYKNPTDPSHCAFQKGHRTEQAPFEWAMSVPSRFNNFNLWMAANREGQNIFLDVYPFEKELSHGLKPDTPLFVDVGGGLGHQCLALKQRSPQVSGRIINQDLPPVIAQAIPCDGVEHMVHDFMTPQPVKGKMPNNILLSESKCTQGHGHIICAMSCMTTPTISAPSFFGRLWMLWTNIP